MFTPSRKGRSGNPETAGVNPVGSGVNPVTSGIARVTPGVLGRPTAPASDAMQNDAATNAIAETAHTPRPLRCRPGEGASIPAGLLRLVFIETPLGQVGPFGCRTITTGCQRRK